MLDKLTKILVAAAVVGVVLIAGWWTLFLRDKLNEHKEALAARDAELEVRAQEISSLRDENAAQAERVKQLNAEIEEKNKRIRSLETALRLLKVDYRLARVEILAQDTAPDGAVTTRLRFTEVDGDGQPLGEGQVVLHERVLGAVRTADHAAPAARRRARLNSPPEADTRPHQRHPPSPGGCPGWRRRRQSRESNPP